MNATKLQVNVAYSNQQAQIEENRLYLKTKRLVDILLSLCGLLLLIPAFLLIVILIKVEDPKGGILFRQKRVGKDGKEFMMFKFRSMVHNAESLLDNLLQFNETTGAMFKMKEDPRVTRVGKVLRKYSLDELPQLFNVLKGDMSLVGPRPPLPREVEQYSNYHYQRLLVVPGCTGLWQVSGRSSLGFEEMVELDLMYISNRTMFYDLKLIFQTVKVMVNSKNAY
ncbi:sugar transferase [Fictibacillus halophilus]|uniref:sugar transferase n=1 Tax=Fictibacillus halophilus TaxID=1610490 RepID=UPI001CFBF27B|nr:sugar transferase [Fictibacillus halophilus]